MYRPQSTRTEFGRMVTSRPSRGGGEVTRPYHTVHRRVAPPRSERTLLVDRQTNRGGPRPCRYLGHASHGPCASDGQIEIMI